MTTANKLIGALVALVLVVGVGFAFEHSRGQASTYQPTAGSTLAPVNDLHQLVTWFTQAVYFGSAQQTSVSSAGAVTVGSSGSAVANLSWANCPLIAASYTVAASTTVPMDCVVAGAQSGDFVMAQFGTTTVPAATIGGWRIVGVSASSTSGYDTLMVRNDTGASAIIPAQIASSTRALNLR